MPRSVPTGELVHQVTPDVVTITDPAGIKGALAGSGGPITVTGEMIVPQAPNLPMGSASPRNHAVWPTPLCVLPFFKTSWYGSFRSRPIRLPPSGLSSPPPPTLRLPLLNVPAPRHLMLPFTGPAAYGPDWIR